MNEKEYNKLLKDIDNEKKRINDPFTEPDQKAYSTENLSKLNKMKEEYEASQKPKIEEKSSLEKAMESTRNNIAKASAAYTPNLRSTKSASLADNHEFMEAENKRDEAKMLNASIPGNKEKVEEAENNIQDLYKENLDALLKDDDEESLQAQNDITNAVAETKGSGEITTPGTIVDNLSKQYGISTNFTPDGKIVPTEESQWKRADLTGKLAMFGTALSCIVSALSGGNIPPINFNKIVGLDKQYTTYLANIKQYNDAISKGVEKEAENKANADYGTWLSSIPENERKIIENISSDYEYTKSVADQERIKTQGKETEDIINAQQRAGINAMLYMHEKVKEGKLPKEAFEHFAQYIRATAGQGAWERGMNLVSQGTEALGNVADAIKGGNKGGNKE